MSVRISVESLSGCAWNGCPSQRGIRSNRLDEQVAGHGLGLAIVRDIAENWGASLQLLDSPLGGLQVRLAIPSRRT